MANIINGSISTNGLGYVKANIDDIQFDKIKAATKSTVVGKSIQSNNDSTVWVNNGNTSNWVGSINTVDIDWNNAQLQSAVSSLESNLQEGVAVSEIKTSGELLKVIAQLQAQVNTLTVLIKGLYNGLSA